MSITLGGWVLLGFVLLVGICFSILIITAGDYKIQGIIGIAVTIVLTIGLMLFLNWYNTSTASGIRKYKDFQSELSNGIEREIIITAEDGREIFHYEGKVDIESNHEDNYIKFESEDGKRYIIYYGIQDTITIIEK